MQAQIKMKMDRHLTDNLYGKECSKEMITQVITEGDCYREAANFKQDKHLANYNLYLHISCTKLK